MGIIQSIFGKEKKNQGLTKEQIRIINLLRRLREILSVIMYHFSEKKEELDKLSSESKAEILPFIKDYNMHLRTALKILEHLEKNVIKPLSSLYVQENSTYLSIDQNSKHSTYSRTKEIHANIHQLIQDTKQKYIQENRSTTQQNQGNSQQKNKKQQEAANEKFYEEHKKAA